MIRGVIVAKGCRLNNHRPEGGGQADATVGCDGGGAADGVGGEGGR